MRTPPLSPWSLATIVLVLSIVFLWPTWATLIGLWSDSTRYSHGYMVAAISVYLTYRQRHLLRAGSAKPVFLALLPLLGLMAIWLLAVLASIQAVQQIILPLIIWTMLLLVLGWQLAKAVLLPVAYLYLAIPIWEAGNFILQWLTVKAVAILLWLFQVPAYIEGNLVSLPAGAFEIAGGCTGLHYFVIALAISVLYGALYVKRLRNQLFLVLLAVTFALLTNWLRVFIVIYAGHLTDMQHYLVTQNHYYFGWVLFTIGMIPYLRLARSVERSEKEEPAKVSEPPAPPSMVSSGRPSVALGCCLISMVILTGIIYAKIPEYEPGTLRVELPAAQGGWTLLSSDGSGWRPYFSGASGEALGSYRSTLGVVDVYVNIYRGQEQGRELVGYENRVEGKSGWIRIGADIRQVELSGRDQRVLVQEIGLSSTAGDRRILYLWYDVNGTHVTRDLVAKLLFGFNLLRGRPEAGVVIASTDCGDDCDDARDRLSQWMQVHIRRYGES